MSADVSPAIFLMGPTASGKTELALQLYDALGCELISVDSVMVYRGMDIGSAKPDAETLQRYPHRLIDINDPADPYSVADFRADALREMDHAVGKRRMPLLVGGSMMYYKALLKGVADMPGANPALRQEILTDARKLGWPALHQRLQTLDPVAAARIHPNNWQRIQRALEVCLTTGRPFSGFWGVTDERTETHWERPGDHNIPYRVITLAIAPASRQQLYDRIEKRFAAMLDLGLVDEVNNLFQRPELNTDLPSVRAVGYRQVWQYLAGEISEAEMILRGEAATRQLAKRQMTWLKAWPNLHWLTSGAEGLLEQSLNIIRSQINYPHSR